MFRGTSDEAAIKAIELFRKAGHFKGYIDQLTDDNELDPKIIEKARVAWNNEDYEFIWQIKSSYFVEYFYFDDGGDFISGIIDWDIYCQQVEYKRNYDEDSAIVIDLNPSSSDEESDEESDDESDEESDDESDEEDE